MKFVLDPVGLLQRVVIQQDLDAVVLHVVAPVVDDKPLDASKHLIELALEPLLAILDHS